MKATRIAAGPLLAPDAAFGAAAFAQIDAALQWTIVGSFGVGLGGSVGFALNRVGGPSCGVDTCRLYLARGDAVESLRAGLGFAF